MNRWEGLISFLGNTYWNLFYNFIEICTILISTHLINEVENIFDEVIFLKDGEIVLYENVEELRFQRGKAVTDVFKEVFSR